MVTKLAPWLSFKPSTPTAMPSTRSRSNCWWHSPSLWPAQTESQTRVDQRSHELSEILRSKNRNIKRSPKIPTVFLTISMKQTSIFMNQGHPNLGHQQLHPSKDPQRIASRWFNTGQVRGISNTACQIYRKHQGAYRRRKKMGLTRLTSTWW